MSPEDRVRAVLAIGARIADPDDPLGREARAALVETTGLHPAGVDLALAEHLETRASAEDVARLSAAPPLASPTTVVLAANVCVAPLRAIALALAASSDVRVKPSRRDPVLARLLVRELAGDARLAAAGVAVREIPDLEAEPSRAVHAYGADETLARIRGSLAPGTIFWGHGTGFGLAIVSAGDAIDEASRLLARAVVPFDQAGCLSPRIALVEGDADRATRFAEALHVALGALGERIPRGALDPLETSAVRAYVETMAASGEAFEGPCHVVGVDPSPDVLVLPPAHRVVHVAPASAADVRALVGPLAPFVAALGAQASGGLLASSTRSLVPGARGSLLGRMQKPRFDGPVDLRARPALV